MIKELLIVPRREMLSGSEIRGQGSEILDRDSGDSGAATSRAIE
jgi:hypothetical protein